MKPCKMWSNKNYLKSFVYHTFKSNDKQFSYPQAEYLCYNLLNNKMYLSSLPTLYWKM